MDQFFLVWNPKGGSPTARHADFLLASKEAERLSKANPGDEFFVLRAEQVKTTPKPVVVGTQTVVLASAEQKKQHEYYSSILGQTFWPLGQQGIGLGYSRNGSFGR